MTYVLLDNTSKYLHAPDWVTIPTEQTLGGSVSRANNTKDFTSFTIAFNGSAVDFYIVVSPFTPPNLPSSITMILDGGSQVWEAPAFRPENASSTDQVARHWYTTPDIDNEHHTITVINFPPHFNFDYATVFTVRKSLPDEDLVIVDSESANIDYSGYWYRTFMDGLVVPLPFSEGKLSLEAYMRSITVGDVLPTKIPTSATYHFNGTAVFAYGILEGPWDGRGNLTVVFTIDGLESKRMYITDGPQMQVNYLWFGRIGLPLASHTIQFTVLESHMMSFLLDYLIIGAGSYIPPNHGMPAWQSSTSGPFSSSNMIPEKLNWTLPNATTIETWGYTKSGQVSKSTVIGVSIGVVVGAVVIGGILLFWFRSRSRRKHESKQGMQDGRRVIPFAT